MKAIEIPLFDAAISERDCPLRDELTESEDHAALALTLDSELKELLKAQRKAADRIQRRKGMIVQHVFFHDLPTKAR